MKRIFIILTLLLSFSAGAQVRSGLYIKDGKIQRDDDPTKIGIEITVRTVKFTPGIYARYAQKYLGIRSQLSERAESEVVSAKIVGGGVKVSEEVTDELADEKQLPENRLDNRIEPVELQAKTTSDLIFSLRKRRMELITGEVGEHVFGAGLEAALREISRLESVYLEMFFGHTDIRVQTQRFNLVPTPGERDCVVARFRNGVGIVPVSDLSGEAVALHMEPALVAMTGVQMATPKDRSFTSVVFPAQTRCTLRCGMKEVASEVIPMIQFGQGANIVLK